MICKSILPFDRLSFYFVDGFLSCADAFKFDGVPFIFAFVAIFFWSQIQKGIAKTNVRELTTYIYFYEYYGFWSAFKSLIYLELISDGVRKWFIFVLLIIAVQFFQHRLLKGPSFPHCIFLLPLLLLIVHIQWVYFWALYLFH